MIARLENFQDSLGPKGLKRGSTVLINPLFTQFNLAHCLKEYGAGECQGKK